MGRGEYIELLRSLAESARAVIDSWESGDLAGAMNALEFDTEQAEEAITEWGGIDPDNDEEK